jgi:hypothetical protein
LKFSVAILRHGEGELAEPKQTMVRKLRFSDDHVGAGQVA